MVWQDYLHTHGRRRGKSLRVICLSVLHLVSTESFVGVISNGRPHSATQYYLFPRVCPAGPNCAIDGPQIHSEHQGSTKEGKVMSKRRDAARMAARHREECVPRAATGWTVSGTKATEHRILRSLRALDDRAPSAPGRPQPPAPMCPSPNPSVYNDNDASRTSQRAPKDHDDGDSLHHPSSWGPAPLPYTRLEGQDIDGILCVDTAVTQMCVLCRMCPPERALAIAEIMLPKDRARVRLAARVQLLIGRVTPGECDLIPALLHRAGKELGDVSTAQTESLLLAIWSLIEAHGRLYGAREFAAAFFAVDPATGKPRAGRPCRTLLGDISQVRSRIRALMRDLTAACAAAVAGWPAGILREMADGERVRAEINLVAQTLVSKVLPVDADPACLLPLVRYHLAAAAIGRHDRMVRGRRGRAPSPQAPRRLRHAGGPRHRVTATAATAHV